VAPSAALALKKSTVKFYSRQLDRHILPAFGSCAICEINQVQIEALLSGLRQKGYGHGALRGVRATFSTVFQAAIRRAISITILRMAFESARRRPGSSADSISLLRYPFHDRTALVTCCGRICIYKKEINLSTSLAGQAVGIKEVDDGIWLVSFMDYDLGYIDLEEKTLQPLNNPLAQSVKLCLRNVL